MPVQLAVFHLLHDNVDAIIRFVGLTHLHDVWVLNHLYNLELISQKIQFVLGKNLLIDYFNGSDVLSLKMLALVHRGELAASEFATFAVKTVERKIQSLLLQF